MQTDLLFVYGTLLDKDNDFGRYLLQNSIFISEGKFRGRLYDVGEYPAAIIDDNAEGFVHGKIYKLSTTEVLNALDDYEGIGKKYPEPHEYKRISCPIDTDKGKALCWIYVYNRETDDLKQILSGCY